MCKPLPPAPPGRSRTNDPSGKAARDSLMAVADGLEATANGLQPLGSTCARLVCILPQGGVDLPTSSGRSCRRTRAVPSLGGNTGEHCPLPIVGASFPVLDGETDSCHGAAPVTDESAIKPNTSSETFPILSEDFGRRVVQRALEHRPAFKALRRQRGAALRRLQVDGYRGIPGESLERLDALYDPVESDLLPDTVQKMFTDEGADAAETGTRSSVHAIRSRPCWKGRRPWVGSEQAPEACDWKRPQASLSGSRLVPMWPAPATRNSPPRTIRAVLRLPFCSTPC